MEMVLVECSMELEASGNMNMSRHDSVLKDFVID